MKFELQSNAPHTNARACKLETSHGEIDTPIFMPVGTIGSVKGVQVKDLIEDIKAQIILGNTYHLYLRPGIGIIEQAGGIHKFIGWNKPLLTDSGGYQIFSLGEIRKINEEGAKFQSHIDGSRHVFTPENVIDIQRSIGADIIMAFDECTPGDADYNYARKSCELTQRWLERCIGRFRETNPKYGYYQSLFPIIQGCIYKDLRIKASEKIAALDCDGIAIGGLSVGESEEVMYEMIEVVNQIIPENKPRYLMGVGTPVNILEAIDRGIDMFDCVLPTRNGRNGMLFTRNGIINIRNNKWSNDFSPIEEEGLSAVDNAYSKAYLRHLFVSKEMLGAQIASIHNLSFFLWLVMEARKHILDGSFRKWKDLMVTKIGKRL